MADFRIQTAFLRHTHHQFLQKKKHITTPCFAEAILQISGSAGILSSWKTWGMSSLLYSRNTTWTRPILTFTCTNRLDLKFSTYPLENYQRYIIIKIKSDSTCIFRRWYRDNTAIEGFPIFVSGVFLTLSSLTVRRFFEWNKSTEFFISTGNSADQRWEKQVAFQRLGGKMSWRCFAVVMNQWFISP